MTKEFEEGWDAHERGFESNPYEPMDEARKYDDWNSGWLAASEEASGS